MKTATRCAVLFALALLASLLAPACRVLGYQSLLVIAPRSMRGWCLDKLAGEGPVGAEPLARVALDPAENRGLRIKALRFLGSMKAEARPAVPVLVKILDTEDSGVAERASATLSEIGPAALPQLIALVEDPARPKMHRLHAITALYVMGDKGAAAVPALLAVLKDPDTRIRGSAILALREIGPAASPAIPALIGILDEDADANNRQQAVAALRVIGRKSPAVKAALTRALADKDFLVREGAGEALKAQR